MSNFRRSLRSGVPLVFLRCKKEISHFTKLLELGLSSTWHKPQAVFRAGVHTTLFLHGLLERKLVAFLLNTRTTTVVSALESWNMVCATACAKLFRSRPQLCPIYSYPVRPSCNLIPQFCKYPTLSFWHWNKAWGHCPAGKQLNRFAGRPGYVGNAVCWPIFGGKTWSCKILSGP